VVEGDAVGTCLGHQPTQTGVGLAQDRHWRLMMACAPAQPPGQRSDPAAATSQGHPARSLCPLAAQDARFRQFPAQPQQPFLVVHASLQPAPPCPHDLIRRFHFVHSLEAPGHFNAVTACV
jgi:hypothetical protein